MFGIIREESQAKYLAPCSCITDLGGEENDTRRRSSPFMPREPCRCFACKSLGGGGGLDFIHIGTRGWQDSNRTGDKRNRWLTHTQGRRCWATLSVSITLW